MSATLSPAWAMKLTSVALGHVAREYPNKLDHVLRGPEDVRRPRELHPVFYGSFDWHSCVHSYWLLARILRAAPEIPDAARIRTFLDSHLTRSRVRVEAAYVETPGRGAFERPYGWAWLLALAAELSRHASWEGRRWTDALQPLTTAVVQRFLEWLPKATYPIRAGTHFNTAFAVALALEYAWAANDGALDAALRERAVA